jgi:hypothetical protein
MTTTTNFHKDKKGITTVDYVCPWCGRNQTSQSKRSVEHGREMWMVVECSSGACKRPALVEVHLTGNEQWHAITSAGGFTSKPVVHPTARPSYLEAGVPPEIRRDFEEALQCQAAGFKYGAALVGRRVLQAAVREKGGHGRDLKAEIDSLPTDTLNAPLKESAHEIRFVGNDAAHADEVTDGDVADLLGFTRDVLHSLYVVPHRVAARKKPPAAAGAAS